MSKKAKMKTRSMDEQMSYNVDRPYMRVLRYLCDKVLCSCHRELDYLYLLVVFVKDEVIILVRLACQYLANFILLNADI